MSREVLSESEKMKQKELKKTLKAEKKALKKAKKEERRREMVADEDKNPLKFREWFSLKGIRLEIKNVHWLSKKELARDASIVLLFTFVLGIYFYFSDIIIAFILRMLGMS